MTYLCFASRVLMPGLLFRILIQGCKTRILWYGSFGTYRAGPSRLPLDEPKAFGSPGFPGLSVGAASSGREQSELTPVQPHVARFRCRSTVDGKTRTRVPKKNIPWTRCFRIKAMTLGTSEVQVEVECGAANCKRFRHTPRNMRPSSPCNARAVRTTPADLLNPVATQIQTNQRFKCMAQIKTRPAA